MIRILLFTVAVFSVFACNQPSVNSSNAASTGNVGTAHSSPTNQVVQPSPTAETKPSEKPQASESQSSIIGKIKNPPANFSPASGCYAALEKDWKIDEKKRPYIFIWQGNGELLMGDGEIIEGNALMNIEGQDVDLSSNKSIAGKGKDSRVWIFENKQMSTEFKLNMTDSQEGGYIEYTGEVQVTTPKKTEKVRIKAGCQV